MTSKDPAVEVPIVAPDPVHYAAALQLLQEAVSAAQRETQVPFEIGFVRMLNPEGARPPLAEMITGGRGDVRLRLYLCIVLRATHMPYDITKNPMPGRWAQMLALPDPNKAGARRINDAFTWLAEHKLIKLTPRRGRTPTIHLLSGKGDGRPYVRPMEIKSDAYYIGVPLGLWRQGWILELSAIELALLLALLELTGGKTSEHPIVTPERRDSYRLSDDTWTRASKGLQEKGLLKVGRVHQGDEYHPERWRNTYWIERPRLADSPWE